MNLPLFLAKRIYADGDRKRRVSRPAITIATAGVAIGLIVMLISVSVVLGFKQTIKDKVIGFGGHIQIANFITLQTSESYPIAINDSIMKVVRSTKGVRHAQRFGMKEGILKTNNDFLGVSFKGVAQDFDTTFIACHLVSGSMPAFSADKNSASILISQSIADRLKVHAGEKIFAYFIDNSGVRVRPFTIAGIYRTNLAQFDKIICFTDLYNIAKLSGWQPDQATGIEVTVNDFEKVDDTQQIFVHKINRTTDKYGNTYAAKTIKDLTPQIFSWLDLLDINVWIILSLMLLVASVTMISGLLIIILERTNMIGLLKAMGARNVVIRRTFLWFAVFIIGRGMFIGNIVAFALLLLQRYTGIVKLNPATYYVSTVPVELNFPLIVALNIATFIVSVLVLILPSYLISHIHPAKSMKYE